MNAKEFSGGSELTKVLRDAVRDNNLELVELLLLHGADANDIDCANLNTPLVSLAVMNRGLAVVKALLRAGANPNVVDVLGRSPMTYAAASGDPQLVKALLEKKSSTQTLDQQGFSPKRVALYRGNREVLKYL